MYITDNIVITISTPKGEVEIKGHKDEGIIKIPRKEKPSELHKPT